jgi:NTE family protein
MARSKTAAPPRARSPDYERIALVLQGGGALGAYQVGVFEALDKAGLCPHWVAGTSIGAINAAIIAGNPPGRRLARLGEFWDLISRPDGWEPSRLDEETRKFANQWHSLETVAFGQPGFFRPRGLSPWLAGAGTAEAVSYYDTAPLRDTLAQVIDLAELNSGNLRLSLGAVNIASGEPRYFDSQRDNSPIGYPHIMASGALPPGFPPVEVEEGQFYWDGGVVSNTPLDVVLDDEPRVNTLCFMVDLWDPYGPLPRSMDDVLEREKDIRYASRSQRNIAGYRRAHDLRRAVMALWQALPAAQRADPELQQLAWRGCTTTMQIVHLIYQNRKYETASKDYEFSRASIAEHRATGLADAGRALADRAWERPVPPHQGVVIHEYPPRNF